MAAVLPPRSNTPRALNKVHATTPTAQLGRAFQYRAPARPREPHQSIRRCRDATLQSGDAYKVRWTPRECGGDVNGAPVCVCRSDGRESVRGWKWASGGEVCSSSGGRSGSVRHEERTRQEQILRTITSLIRCVNRADTVYYQSVRKQRRELNPGKDV